MSSSYCWRTSGFVYFLFTNLQIVVSFDLWSTTCAYLRIECCRKPQIEFNKKSLTLDLTKFHGQPFASSLVPNLLGSHLSYVNVMKGPLCFYFHGDTGTGKTFLTKLIIKNIYQYQTKSKFVTFFYLGKDYRKDETDTHITELLQMMYLKVISCQKSLFVLDGYSNCWFRIVNYISLYKKTFMNAIFIFISNSDLQEIHAYMQKKQNHKSAMHYDDLVDSAKKKIALLDNINMVYVPFLPMHRDDVYQCISDQLAKLKYPKMTHIKELIYEITALLEFTNDISVSGCKKVADKTALFLAQYISTHQEL